MKRYRVVEKYYSNGEILYVVQVNPLFGFPFLWFTATYLATRPPHPDLLVPVECTVECKFKDINDAIKCFEGFVNHKRITTISKKIIRK